MAKVLNQLAREGLVKGSRGPKGGYRLGRAADEITLKEVYRAIEGPFELSRCMFGIPICDGSGCVLGDFFGEMSGKVEAMMASTTVSQICLSMKGKLGE